MTLINDLFDMDLFDRMVAEGFVRTQTHPEFPELSIVNYTESAQFSRTWNDVTRNVRGLIYNTETGEVLARPFSKLHNWDEPEAPKILDWKAPVFSWSNKFDGSLGIAYIRPDGALALATRGSFASTQAIRGTELLLEDTDLVNYTLGLIEVGYTPLFEIVGPDNRIVLSYEKSETVPLGAIHIATGEYMPHHTFDTAVRTFDDVIRDLSRENAEGWVVWLSPRKAVKIKQADYIELHRVVTGLNRKTIWRTLQDGTFRDLVVQLPDELFAWAEEVAGELLREYSAINAEAESWYVELTKQFLPDRKAQAMWINGTVPGDFRGMVFAILDGKPLDKAIWAIVEPMGNER